MRRPTARVDVFNPEGTQVAHYPAADPDAVARLLKVASPGTQVRCTANRTED